MARFSKLTFTSTVRWLLVAIAVHVGFLAADAQEAVTADSIQVSLITYYPGSEVYELYGHTALRVRCNGYDALFNYGVFDFRAPNFTYRFVKGETDYMVCGYSAKYLSDGYANRKIVEQVLNLTQEEAQKVKTALEVNVLPENRVYRYNYVLDNCATRPRDIIEKALGNSLRYPDMPEELTFRQEMREYNKNYAWQQFGIDLALGSGIDYTITYRQQMFVPMVLMDAFSKAVVTRNGVQTPLVGSSATLNPGSDKGAVLPPTPWLLTPLSFSIILLLSAIVVSIWDLRRKKSCRILDFILFIIYGLGGCLIFFLILFSTHEATSPNFNALWLHPFYLLPAILMWIKSCRKVVYFCHFLIFAVVLMTMAFWWILPQTANMAIFPFMAAMAVRALSYMVIYRNA